MIQYHRFPIVKYFLFLLGDYYFIGIITYPYKYWYGQYRVIFPSASIWRVPVLWSRTKTFIYVPIEEFNVYSLGNWAMSRCLTSDALSFPLNLQYNSLPIEKAARVPYPPQLMYLILSIFTLLFNPPDETLLSSYFCSSIFLENTGFFWNPWKIILTIFNH